jgi:hypothetical protein
MMEEVGILSKIVMQKAVGLYSAIADAGGNRPAITIDGAGAVGLLSAISDADGSRPSISIADAGGSMPTIKDS